METPEEQLTLAPYLRCYFMLIGSIAMSPVATSSAAKRSVRVDVSALKHFPVQQMGFLENSQFPGRCF